jgi:hypothetical protein
MLREEKHQRKRRAREALQFKRITERRSCSRYREKQRRNLVSEEDNC